MHSGTLLPDAVPPVHEDQIASVYRFAVRKGGIDAVETVAEALGLPLPEVIAAVDHLVEIRLLREERDCGGLLMPVDPRIAVAALVSPMEREIYQRRERIAQLRERIELFREDYHAASGAPDAETGSVEQVCGSLEVRGYLHVAAETCREEILVLRSGPQEGVEPDDFLPVCLALLERGVSVRIIYQHRSRADLPARMRIRSLAEAGALVRTVSHIPRAAVVFDRSVAVLLGHSGGESVASRVRNAGVVQFLLGMFDHLWDTAAPLDWAESGYADVTDDLRQTIATLMANGLTDEAMARRLGMSVRTCRRHIAALMRDLDAKSRFQAGVQAARRSLVAEEA